MQNSQQAFDELQAFQKNRRKAPDILREQEIGLGVDAASQRKNGLRTAIANTENLIRSVEPSVSGRTSGSLVTDAQKSRLVSLERQPLQEQFRTESQALDNETANINELRNQARTAAQLQMAEDDQRQQAMTGLYGTLYQREQDAVAKAERDRAFAEQQRQAAASQSAIASMFGGATQPGTTGFGKATNPTDQDAYNDVRNRVAGDDTSIISDYRATLESARRGNMRDKAKIQFYHALRPDLFTKSVPASAVLSNQVSF